MKGENELNYPRFGVEAAFQNYKTENCWETQLAAIFLFNADGCGWLPST